MLVILVELPHVAYNSAESVISLIDSECVFRFYTYVSLGHNKRVEYCSTLLLFPDPS